MDGNSDFNKSYSLSNESYSSSNNLEDVDLQIKQLRWNLRSLDVKKKDAKSLTEFYNYGKLMRAEIEKIRHALIRYKVIEIEQNLPVNLEYRMALKKLNGNYKK